MTAGGWVLLVLSCGTVTALVLWCFWKVLTMPPPGKDLHAPLDIDTRDVDERP
jgi:hypothetical protein